MVGWFSLGLNSSGPEEAQHFNDMRDAANVNGQVGKCDLIARWHVLVVSAIYLFDFIGEVWIFTFCLSGFLIQLAEVPKAQQFNALHETFVKGQHNESWSQERWLVHRWYPVVAGWWPQLYVRELLVIKAFSFKIFISFRSSSSNLCVNQLFGVVFWKERYKT